MDEILKQIQKLNETKHKTKQKTVYGNKKYGSWLMNVILT